MPKPARPIPDDLAAMAKIHSFESLCRHYRAGCSTVTQWLKKSGLVTRGPLPRAMPSDFKSFAPGRGLVELMRHYGASSGTVRRWREMASIREVPMNTARFREMPDNFAQLAPRMTKQSAAAFWGASDPVLRRWCNEAGISFKRVQVYRHPGSRPVISETTRDQSVAGRAADFLQKLAPIHRCDADGTANKNGTHWRRNLRVMTAEQVIERAQGLGFDPDGWKRLPVPAVAAREARA